MSNEIATTVRPSRRTLLKTVGAVGVAAAGGVLSRQVFSPAFAASASKIRLAWTEVAACHSPLGFGVAKGIYAKHNLDVELFYQGASGQTLIQALATGKADAGAGLIGDWLKPLEQGFDVKLFVGSHGGCQRLLASQASGIKDLAGVKGKTIATYGIGAPPQVAFQVTLFSRRRLQPSHCLMSFRREAMVSSPPSWRAVRWRSWFSHSPSRTWAGSAKAGSAMGPG
jgi:NitT/TauT family transport system substrate-binding protein